MISEAIDFRFLLLESYKKLKINEQELAVIFMIDHLIGQGNPFINNDILSLKMSLSLQEIDKIMAGLYTRGLVEYITEGKKTVTTLNPLKKILYREFQMTSTFEEASKNSKHVAEMIDNVYGEFEKLLNRPLSQVEFSRIREWISYGYSDEMIISALKETLGKGKRSLRSVDKVLISWQERDQREEEGISSRNETWDKSLEETIRIAKTPWLDQIDDSDDKK